MEDEICVSKEPYKYNPVVAGAHSCRLRKTGSAHCYLTISAE